MIGGNAIIIDPSNGSKLNLFFKSGTVRPVSVVNNTVWVNTPIAVKTVYIRWTEPKDPKIGDVWIVNGYQLGEDYEPVISADRTLTVYENPFIGVPINGAKQWDGTAWVRRGLSLYKDGAWVDVTPDTATHLPVIDLPNGSLVRIVENGTATNFIKLTNCYYTDVESPTGNVLLLRERVWASAPASMSTGYEDASTCTWLNEDYIGLFPEAVQNIIAEVPVQCSGDEITTGNAKAFLLSATEMGLDSTTALGVPLDYFADTAKRIAYTDENKLSVQLTRQRSYTYDDGTCSFYAVGFTGERSTVSGTTSVGIRPAFAIRWSDTYVNPEPNEDGSYTLIVEEVAS